MCVNGLDQRKMTQFYELFDKVEQKKGMERVKQKTSLLVQEVLQGGPYHLRSGFSKSGEFKKTAN